MSYAIGDMSETGRKILADMKSEIANYNDLVDSISAGFAIKKFFDNPLSSLLEFVLPGPTEWDALTELLKQSSGLKGVLKKKLDLHWLTYTQNKSKLNEADNAFIEALYRSVKNS